MSVGNINNWFNYLSKRRVSELKDTDLIPVGRSNRKSFNFWSPRSITYKELKRILGGFSDIPIQDNTWNMPGVAFVDPVNGDNNTGNVGDGNKPYSTVSAAILAGPDAIFLLPGNYSETINLTSGMTYFSYPGVTFVSGGLRAISTQEGTKWLGYSSFIGDFQMIYFNNSVDLIDFTIEFDEIIETGTSAARALVLYGGTTNLSTVNVKGRKLNAKAANAHGLYVRNRLGGSITIDEIISDYGTINAFAHDNAELEITFKKAIVRDGGFAGNLANYSQVFISYISTATSKIILNGDMYNEVASLQASNGATVTTWLNCLGTVIINGSIFANVNRGIYNTGGNIILRGSLNTSDLAVQSAAGNTSFEGSNITQGKSSLLSGTGKTWLSGCQVNSTAVDHIIDVTANINELYVHNTVLEGSAGLCVEHNATTATIGFANTSSNLANSALTDAYTPSGFLQQTGITTPNF